VLTWFAVVCYIVNRNVLQSYIMSIRRLSSRCQFLLVLLLLTAVLIAGHRHVTRAESYPPQVRRHRAEKEKFPETNGMFFGKRSSIHSVKTSPASRDSAFLRAAHQRHGVGLTCRRHDLSRSAAGSCAAKDSHWITSDLWLVANNGVILVS